MTAKFKVGDLVDMRPPSGHGRWIRDHTDAVIAYVTARAAWLREEPPRE